MAVATLRRTLATYLSDLPEELGVLLRHLTAAGRTIANEVRGGTSSRKLHRTTHNVHGEKITPLDHFAHETLCYRLRQSGQASYIASEEADQPMLAGDGPYDVTFDPLDGSSNIDVGISVGTIFGIYPRQIADRGCLPSGSALIAAGYILYGSSTVLICCAGDTVQGFTLSRNKRFALTHPNIRMPERGATYSINEAYSSRFDHATVTFVDELKATGCSARYVGSLVADFHRTLLQGGVFLYPALPQPKLRLCYEAAPLAFIAEHAGGSASTGTTSILNVIPTTVHERTPLVIGSTQHVRRYEELCQ